VLGLDRVDLLGYLDDGVFSLFSVSRDMRLVIARIVLTLSKAGVSVGTTSVFSANTKAESRATISSGAYSASTFSRMSSVRTSSSAEWICGARVSAPSREVASKWKGSACLTCNLSFQLDA
jgi:hypothetical protein